LARDGVIEQGHPLGDIAIRGDDQAGLAVSTDDHVVEVRRLLCGELVEAEVVGDEDVRREIAAQLAVEGVVGGGMAVRSCVIADANRTGSNGLAHPAARRSKRYQSRW